MWNSSKTALIFILAPTSRRSSWTIEKDRTFSLVPPNNIIHPARSKHAGHIY
jgi:hypothetical protein